MVAKNTIQIHGTIHARNLYCRGRLVHKVCAMYKYYNRRYINTLLQTISTSNIY